MFMFKLIPTTDNMDFLFLLNDFCIVNRDYDKIMYIKLKHYLISH